MKSRTVIQVAAILAMFHPCLSQDDRPSFTASLNAGYAFLSPAELNSWITRFSWMEGWIDPMEEIHGGPRVSVDVGFCATEMISIHLVGSAMVAKTAGKSYGSGAADGPVLAEREYRITALPLGIGAMYHVPYGIFALGVGVFADWNIVFVDNKYTITDLPVGTNPAKTIAGSKHTRATQLGGHVLVVPEFTVTKWLCVQMELGYQLLKVSGTDWTFWLSHEKMTLDLSGPYATAGLRFRF